MKALPKGNTIIRPFVTHKHQLYTFTVGSGSTNPNVISFDTMASFEYINTTMSMAVGHSYAVGELFQFGNTLASPDPVDDHHRSLLGISASIAQLFYGKRGLNAGIDRGFLPVGLAHVISFAQPSYGEAIQPKTLIIRDLNYTGSIIDQYGDGRLFVSGATTPIGNIFYSQGIAVIQGRDQPPFASQSIYSNGITYETGSAYSFNYNATHTIYEHTYICTMDEGEFNYTFNPSITALSSSVSGSTKVIDAFASGTLTPYMTTIGLYNSHGELCAIGKFPRAIKRAPESQQTIIIRFDV